MDFRLLDKYFVWIFLRVAKVHVVCVPQKILEQFVRILLLNNEAGSLDNIAAVLNKSTTLRGKLVVIYGRAFEDICEGSVDLLVGRITPLAESLYGTIESELKEGGE